MKFPTPEEIQEKTSRMLIVIKSALHLVGRTASFTDTELSMLTTLSTELLIKDNQIAELHAQMGDLRDQITELRNGSGN